MVARDLHKITFKLHEQRAKLAPSLLLRQRMLTAAFHDQIRSEKENIASHINRLQHGTRRAYLMQRLTHLDERAKLKPIGL